VYIPPVFHELGRQHNRIVQPKSGGLFLLRRITPPARRDVVYSCSGAYSQQKPKSAGIAARLSRLRDEINFVDRALHDFKT
jgi:hypothetical protein